MCTNIQFKTAGYLPDTLRFCFQTLLHKFCSKVSETLCSAAFTSACYLFPLAVNFLGKSPQNRRKAEMPKTCNITKDKSFILRNSVPYKYGAALFTKN